MKILLAGLLLGLMLSPTVRACAVSTWGPEYTNPELVWVADVIVLAKIAPEWEENYSFRALELLKGDEFPNLFNVPQVEFGEIHSGSAEGESLMSDSRFWDCDYATLDPEMSYLIFLREWPRGSGEFELVGLAGSRSIEPARLDGPWLAAARIYVEAEHKGKDAFLRNFLEKKGGIISPLIKEDIEHHLKIPTESKSPKHLRTFLNDPDPLVRAKTFLVLDQGDRFDMAQDALEAVRSETNGEALTQAAEYFLYSEVSEAASVFLEKWNWANNVKGEEAEEFRSNAYSVFELLYQCAEPELSDGLYALTIDDEMAWDVLWKWWVDKDELNIVPDLRTRLGKRDAVEEPEVALLLANKGDPSLLDWAETQLSRGEIAAPGVNDPAPLPLRIVAFSRLNKARQMRQKLYLQDGDWLAQYVKAMFEVVTEEHLRDLDKILATTQSEPVLAAIERGLAISDSTLLDRQTVTALEEKIAQRRTVIRENSRPALPPQEGS